MPRPIPRPAAALPSRVVSLVAGGCVAAGAVAVVVAVVALCLDRSAPTSFGDPVLGGSPAAVAPAFTGVRVAGGIGSGSAASDPAPGAASGPPPSPPTTLHVPSLAVSADVESVVVRDGLLGVPDDISRVGWWQDSARAGSRSGTTVIDGHVDSAADGQGALFGLQSLQAGDRIVLGTRNSGRVTYRVYARHVYVKADGLPPSLFAGRARPRLVLITCGGPFDAGTRSYLDNVAVFAAPLAT